MLRRFLKELGKHSFIYSIGFFISTLVSLILLPIYTRFLDPSEYGTLSLINYLISFLSLVCLVGMGASLTRFMHYYKTEKEQREVIGAAFLFIIITGLIGFCILFSFSSPLAKLLLGKVSWADCLQIAAVILFFSCVQTVNMSYFQTLKLSKTYLFYSLLGLFLGVFLNLYFIIVLKLGVRGMLYGQAISSIIPAIIASVQVISKNKPCFSWQKLKVMLKYGLPIVPALLLAQAMHNIDQYLLRFYKGLDAVGLYSLGYRFPFMLNTFFLFSINAIWGKALIFEIYEKKEAKYIYARTTTYLMSLYIYGMFCLSVFSPFVMKIFAAPEYFKAYKVMPVVCLGLIPYAFHAFLSVGIKILNKTWFFPLTFGVGTIVNIFLNIFLIPKFGYMGAAWATVAAYTVFGITSYFLYKRVYFIPFEWNRLALVFFWCVGLYLISQLLPVHSFILNFVYKSLLCLSLPLWLYLFSFFTDTEKNEILHLLTMFKRRISVG